jgi:hypothetical protein
MEITGLKAVINAVRGDIVKGKAAVESKQPLLVSGTNIKTVGGVSLLGAGNIPVSSGGSGGSVFTFVVDSDAALAAWADNTAGNDYTSVLIAPGTFISSKEVNLTACGTKSVVGMPGSLLSFSSRYGLRYETLPKTTEYRMDGVNAYNSAANGYGFHDCANLTNCTGNGTSADGYGYGFRECANLTNCIANGNGVGNGYGFYGCTNLTNCTGNSNATANAYGFYSCTNLTNCTGTAISAANAYGFYGCTNLTNCTGTGTVATGSAHGFRECANLTNCTGTATAGYGFRNCKGMVLNKATSTSNVAYGTCFVSISGSGTIPADTAAGGWNVVLT